MKKDNKPDTRKWLLVDIPLGHADIDELRLDDAAASKKEINAQSPKPTQPMPLDMLIKCRRKHHYATPAKQSRSNEYHSDENSIGTVSRSLWSAIIRMVADG